MFVLFMVVLNYISALLVDILRRSIIYGAEDNYIQTIIRRNKTVRMTYHMLDFLMQLFFGVGCWLQSGLNKEK